jgi:hypothetical protein
MLEDYQQRLQNAGLIFLLKRLIKLVIILGIISLNGLERILHNDIGAWEDIGSFDIHYGS